MSLTLIENEAINSFRKKSEPSLIGSKDENYLKYFLWLSLHLGKMVRYERSRITQHSHMLKHDGSPATKFESDVESFIIKNMRKIFPEIKFLGEELGGEIPKTGLGLAVDPIDGTWSFLSQNNTISTSIALFKNQKAILGIVLNAATGELGYCLKGMKSRMIQVDLFGEEDFAYDLPNKNSSESDKILVNFHPNKNGKEEIIKLYDLWKAQKIRMVKSPGGSPAWAILESAKGDFIYINKWNGAAAKSYDLAAAHLIIEGAGGFILDRDLNPIPEVGHKGMFLTGVSLDLIKNFLKIL